ncbi:MAG: PD40 domain-containing protein, partial [Gemmatimonadetes bacterium]|nr:PD40 domain-containing protein [Gemmatimonadota bacterium]
GTLFWADALLTFKAAAFDVEGSGVTGEPIVLADRVGRGAAFGIAAAVADDGTLLLEQGASATSGLGENLGWIDLDGNIDIIEPEWSDQFSDFDGVALSPDARYAAVQVDMTGLEASAIDPAEIWILDLQERSSYRLTFDGSSRYPAWLPDGRVAYLRESTDEFSEILAQPYDRSGPETSLLQIDRFVNAFTVAPDGTLVLEIATGTDGVGIYLAEPGRPESLRPFVDSRFAEFGAAVSPDGRWLAYASEESGRPQLFVRSFPDGGRPWPISRGLGVWPLWGPDSETLFYLGGRRMEFAMLDTSDGLSVQGRGSFFQTDVVEIGYGVVHPDGDRILMTIEPTASEGARRLRLFTDIFGEIERRIEGS